jgi:hypothetical protein
MLDGAVLAGRIHGLKNQQQGMVVVGIQQALLHGEVGDVLLDKLPVLLARFVQGLDGRRALFEPGFLAFHNAKIVAINLHFPPPVAFTKFGAGWKRRRERAI